MESQSEELKLCKNREKTVAHEDDFGSPNYMDELSDELVIMEILSRVERCEVAFQCKLVSKRWRNLISCPFFGSQFVRNHTNSPPVGLFLNYRTVENKEGTLLYYSEDHAVEFGSGGFSFKFLPHFRNDEQRDRNPMQGFVRAVYGDLVLLSMERRRLSEAERSVRNYVICNPRTMQWVQLPPLSTDDFSDYNVVLVCDDRFICPFNTETGKYYLNDCYKYRVVRIPAMVFNLERRKLFNSEAGRWGKLALPSLQDGFICLQSVVYNGMVLLCDFSNILAFDPFVLDQMGGVVAYRIIDLPKQSITGLSPFGSNRLRVSTLDKRQNSYVIQVWDLEDYDNSGWSLKHEICLKDIEHEWCLKHQISTEELRKSIKLIRTRVLGFHPFEDILYLHFYVLGSGDQVVEINMRTKTIEAMRVVTEQPTTRDIMLTGGAHIIHLPVWPTPVPMLK